jgi:hypothetical protein
LRISAQKRFTQSQKLNFRAELFEVRSYQLKPAVFTLYKTLQEK